MTSGSHSTSVGVQGLDKAGLFLQAKQIGEETKAKNEENGDDEEGIGNILEEMRLADLIEAEEEKKD